MSYSGPLLPNISKESGYEFTSKEKRLEDSFLHAEAVQMKNQED